MMAASAPAAGRAGFPDWLLATLLLLATVAVFWRAMDCQFVDYDDEVYVTENPHVRAGLTGEAVKWCFSNTERGGYWAPLMWLSHAAVCQFFGLQPWAHHLVNVLLHAASTALLFLIFSRITGAKSRSLLLAALFGWHPLRVESVAWITERKDTLSTLFWMLSLWAYVHYVAANRKKSWYALSLLFMACGLLSKAMLVTLPCVLLLLDYWPLKRISDSEFQISNAKLGVSNLRSFVIRHSSLVIEKIPFFMLSVAASVVTVLAQGHGGTMMDLEQLSFTARVQNALVSCCRYVGKLFWPARLAVFYPFPAQWPLATVVLAAVFLLGVTVLVLTQWRRFPYLPVGWLWFVGTLVPVIGLTQSGEQAMADRFSYVPSIGIFIMVIWSVCAVTAGWRNRTAILSLLGSAAVIACLTVTEHQLTFWRDSETLFNHALAVTENNFVAHDCLGIALGRKGETDAAISQFQEAVRLGPNHAQYYYNLGNALNRKGRTDEAISQYQEALRRKPGYAEAHLNLGAVFFNQGRFDDAISQFQEAVRLKPDNATYREDLAQALKSKAAQAGH